MNISLVMVTADGKTKDLPAMRLPISIGRGEECKIRVPLAAVSRKHCELLEQDDELIVRDLKSSNGTFVNKERVKSRELIPGDLLAVGPIVFVVRIDGHPKAIDGIISYANGAMTAADLAERPMMDGVPSFGETPKKTPGAPVSPTKTPSKPANDDSDDFSQILADLSDTDFDLDDSPPGGSPPPKSPASKK